MLELLPHLVTVAIDVWTSRYNDAFVGISVHFMHNFIRINKLIGLVPIFEKHTGENLGKIVLECVKKYRIEDKIGYIITDNAANNISMVEFLSQKLQNFKAKNHIRCFNHVINLIIQMMCFSSSGKSNVESSIIIEDSNNNNNNMNPKRKRGNKIKRREKRRCSLSKYNLEQEEEFEIDTHIELNNSTINTVLEKLRRIIKHIRQSSYITKQL